MLHIIWSIIIGFIIGLIARAIMPGAQHLRLHNDRATRNGWLDRRRTDRPVVFQTGAGLGVSSGRFNHVDYWRNNSALYLDKISGLTKSIRTLGEKTYVSIAPWMFRLHRSLLSQPIRPKSHC